jgi:hypothetical protein
MTKQPATITATQPFVRVYSEGNDSKAASYLAATH